MADTTMRASTWNRHLMGVQKVTLLRFSIWVAFVAYITYISVMALHWSGYDGGFWSGKTVYRVNISTGEIAVERVPVVARK